MNSSESARHIQYKSDPYPARSSKISVNVVTGTFYKKHEYYTIINVEVQL